MTTATMGRILLAIGGLGSLTFVGSGFLGWRLEGQVIARHVLASLMAVLLVVLSNIWVQVFLWAGYRAVRVTASEVACAIAQPSRSLWTSRLLALVAVALSIATFFSGTRVFTVGQSAEAHLIWAVGTLLCQLVALFYGSRCLAFQQRQIAELRPLT